MAEDIDRERIADGTPTDRRDFLKAAGFIGAAGAVAGAAHGKFALAPISAAQAQTPPQAAGAGAPPWWPSKWGAADETGSSNHTSLSSSHG